MAVSSLLLQMILYNSEESRDTREINTVQSEYVIGTPLFLRIGEHLNILSTGEMDQNVGRSCPIENANGHRFQ